MVFYFQKRKLDVLMLYQYFIYLQNFQQDYAIQKNTIKIKWRSLNG